MNDISGRWWPLVVVVVDGWPRCLPIAESTEHKHNGWMMDIDSVFNIYSTVYITTRDRGGNRRGNQRKSAVSDILYLSEVFTSFRASKVVCQALTVKSLA